MINKLSRVTAYIETYAFDQRNGEMVKRAHATGFFVKTKNKVLLVTNWHVVTGLNPANPSSMLGKCIPEVLKVTVISKSGTLTELTFPLYDRELQPLWDEHHERNLVDMIVYPVPSMLEEQFYLFDILSEVDDSKINQSIGSDVFILGYPFSKESMQEGFGEDNHYYLPVWKRGSIATEPELRINRKLILIDTMSRPGMSGSPVVICEEQDVMRALTDKGEDIIKRLHNGDALAALEITPSDIVNEKKKTFNVLGIYSGVIGSTRLQELALGKCWHIDTLVELVKSPASGLMPHHEPLELHEHYERFLNNILGVMITRDTEGNEKSRVTLK